MLKKIMIENNSGISKPITLNFEKGNYQFNKDHIYKDTIVSPSVLYGLNSSGKTSILRTFQNLFFIFNEDLTENHTYGIKNIFLDKIETKINLLIQLKEIEYDYTVIIIEKNKIIDERLEINDNENRIIYTRSDYKNKSNINLSDKKSFIRDSGSELKNNYLTEVYEYFKNICFVSTGQVVFKNDLMDNSWAKELVENNKSYKKISKEFNEIMDLQFKIKNYDNNESITAVYKEKDMDYQTMISSGTRDFYEMISIIIKLPENSLLIIDEIEKTFHPDLLSKLINYIIKNFKVQIISSSHNTNFMKGLRPDQLFITKKNQQSDIVEVSRISEAYPGIREVHNIEKLYMGGKFE